MSRERPLWGLALKWCLLIAMVCLAVHVYLGLWRWARTPRPPSNDQQSQQRVRPDVTSRRTHLAWHKPTHRQAEPDRGMLGDSGPVTPCCPLAQLHKKIPRWHIELQPWAGPQRSLEEEAKRFLAYIETPQVSCVPPTGHNQALGPEELGGPWQVCLDDRYTLAQRIWSKQCRVYSLGLGSDTRQLELELAQAGCEVHRFDPSGPQAHLHDSAMWHHRLSVGWRDPNPAVPRLQRRGTTKKLGTILSDFGHRKIDVLKADMESAEWKILENLILEDILPEIGQLLLEVHLHWPGFEVDGDDATVVRYWYSLLKELEHSHFQLFYSRSTVGRPRLFLRRNLFNASSAYTLGWVNSKWTQR